MAKPFAKKLYGSKAWLECRAAYISKVFGLCERCKKPGYILHHTVELTPENITDPYIALNHDLLEYLCLECHNAVGADGVTRNDLIFNSAGDLVIYLITLHRFRPHSGMLLSCVSNLCIIGGGTSILTRTDKQIPLTKYTALAPQCSSL